MTPADPAPAEIVLGTERLRIVFRWIGDRYAHEVQQHNAGHWRTLATSREGTAADSWPASPPLQQLHGESRSEGVELMLGVGMAGRSHWSASIALLPDEGAIEFDVACRVFEAPQWLGSRYAASAAEPFAPAASLPGQILFDAGTVQVAAPLEGARLPRTVRWGYRLVMP